MKYIRTKNGKILDLKRYKNKTTPISKARGFITLIDKLKICDIEICENDIIKQADTIEELCDELVVHNPNNDNEFFPQWFVYLNSWKNMLNKRHAKHCVEAYDKPVEIYGAIWTDKGLQFVARMNSEGVLELL